jgi:hypothetical protein
VEASHVTPVPTVDSPDPVDLADPAGPAEATPAEATPAGATQSPSADAGADPGQHGRDPLAAAEPDSPVTGEPDAAAGTEAGPVEDLSVEATPAKTTRAKVARAARAPREPVPDAVCAAAVDEARAAAVDEAGDASVVGEHLGVEVEGDRLVLHRFACTSRAYPGWAWTVVVARAPRTKKVTVDDVVLMPHTGALLAPMWIPWSQRLRPGDVGVGDLLPTAVDDPRLALRVTDVEEFADTDAFLELGLGRPRVLSAQGREDACERWYSGEPGPDASVAKVAPATCLTCGFHVRLAGALGRMFGVCANELAPDDARVTSLDHGCGAHSEALVAPSAHPEPIVFEDDPGGAVPGDIELVGVGVGADSADATPGDEG